MSAFRCMRALAAPATRPTTLFRASASRWSTSQQTRSLTLLTPRRPLLPSTSSPMPSFQLPGSGGPLPATTTSSESTLDLAGKISQHPALGSMQIRAGPRDTFNPSHFVRKRRHGFLARLRTKKGRKLLLRRIKKGRWNLSH